MTKNKSKIRLFTVLILVAALVATMGSFTVSASTAKTYDGFKYVVRGSGAKYGSGVYIKAYVGSKSSITIPKKINGRNVVSVDLDEEGLKAVNVKKATKIKYLDLSENRLKSISLTKNKSLKKLDVSENRLKKINLKYNKKLVDLDVSDNRLTKLSTKYNKKLVDLDASDNKLKSVYLKTSTKLRELDLSDNKLTKLNLSKNLQLRELDIEGNSGLSWFTMNNLAKHKYMRDFTGANGQEWEKD